MNDLLARLIESDRRADDQRSHLIGGQTGFLVSSSAAAAPSAVMTSQHKFYLGR